MFFRIDRVFLLSIIILISVFLQFLPLVNVIGYEFSAASGIILYFLLGLYTARNAALSMRNSNRIFLSKFDLIFYVVSVLVPLVVSIVNTVIFQICPMSGGVLFYFVQAVPCSVMGIAVGVLSTWLSIKLRYLFFIFFFLFLMAVPLTEIYFYPQIYFFSSLLGFFPGTIYDEDIPITAALIVYRLVNLFYFSLLFVLLLDFFMQRKARFKMLAFIAWAFAGFLFISLKTELGYATDEKRLRNILSEEAVTDYYTIIYDNSLDKRILKDILLNHSYYVDEFNAVEANMDWLNFKTFLFSNREQKRNLFGSGAADVSKPWQKKIFTDVYSYENTLKHEISHLTAGGYSNNILRLAGGLNPAMIEGYAVAVENNYSGYNIHYLAALAVHNNYNPSVKELFGSFNFFNYPSSLAYIFSGSFIKYLMDFYGIDKVNALYGDINFSKHFDKNLIELESEYYEFIDSLKIENNKHTAQLFFGRRPIFKKICARYTANQLKNAQKNFRDGNYFKAAKIFEEIYNYSESYQALTGFIRSLVLMNQANRADSILSAEINKYYESSYFYNLELQLADIKAIAGDSVSAAEYYDSLTFQQPSLEYYSAAYVRKNFLNQGIDSLRAYLTMVQKEKFSALSKMLSDRNDYLAIPVLLGLAELNDSDFIEKLMANFVASDLLSAYASYESSVYFTRAGKYDLAKKHAVESLKFDDERFREVWRENLKKIIWFSNFSGEVLSKVKYSSYLGNYD